jgi:crotonobetainyl-CoA:carnitine CoA-transferase CaiB-like acyl-CoA transferase
MLARVPDDDLGTVTMPDVVPRLSATPGAIRHAGHRIGQDTRKVLHELAGLSPAEIDALEDERVISCGRPVIAKDAGNAKENAIQNSRKQG